MIDIKNVNKHYRKPNAPIVTALHDVSLSIETGEFIAILGPSGSGKTTLMNMLGLLDKPDSGTYHLDGQDMYGLSENQLARIRNQKIGFVFQSFHLLARTNAVENVQLPLLYADAKDFRQRSEQALAAVGLSERAHHFTHELSGGQQQRVAIARAIVNQPNIILADEPTGNLDSESEQDIIQLFKSINQQGKTVIFITHSAEVAASASRVITIRDGQIVNDSTRTASNDLPLEGAR